ncbi:YybS family protein [Paenibacillus sp. CC-CFT747]|nr:YybS family protein [Paenibacillus sp. CC-CFT747]
MGALPLFFLPSVIAMERMYRKRNLARLAILSGTLTLLAELLVLLVVSKLFGYNLVESLRNMLTDSLVSLPEAWKSMVTPETIDNSVYYVIQSLPVFMIAFCVWYVFVCHAAGRWLLRKTGVTVPALSPVRKWKLPKSLVWYYLAVMILDFMVKPDSDPFLFTVVWNLLPLLTFAFAVQALSFLSYVTYHKRKGRFLPAAAVCLTILFPPLSICSAWWDCSIRCLPFGSGLPTNPKYRRSE